uniref:Uncharacterized protein n=1 Tax=Chenopodium quinoa TaxID=63459 RepID=A0A803KVQ0_CHEQI
MYHPKKEGGMGFRNMSLFNNALLAKQGWRILTNENSLMAKILKGKYFPNSSFLDAAVSPAASYTWKSICNARWVLRKGVRKIIGSGASVDIWKDPWVPSLPDFRVDSVNRTSDQGRYMVDELLIEGSWDIGALVSLFSRVEIDAIRKIPTSMYNTDDCWTWMLAKSGDFSVRSAYNHLLSSS